MLIHLLTGLPKNRFSDYMTDGMVDLVGDCLTDTLTD